MNKVNFDSLNNIKAPEQWIKNAAAIPELPQKKRTFPLYRVAAAASIVLVSVIVLLVFFFGGNKTPVTVISGSTAASEPRIGETSADASADAPDGTVILSATGAAGSPTGPSESETDAVSGTQPTGGGTSPYVPAPSAAPTVSRATEKPVSTEPPAESEPAPTDVSAQSPVPADDPTDIQKPTEIWLSPESVVSFSATFDVSLLSEGENVYCIVMKEGYSWASSVKQKADYFITKNGVGYAYCDMPIGEDAAEEETITYRYLFISESGRTLASGTQVV